MGKVARQKGVNTVFLLVGRGILANVENIHPIHGYIVVYMHLFKIINFFLDAGPAPEGGYIPFAWMVKYYKFKYRHLRGSQPIPVK